MDKEKSLNSVNIAPEDAVHVLDEGQGWIALLRKSGEEVDIVNAARVSFGKMRTEMNDKDVALLKFLIDEKHFAPFEHITFTFLVHCPLFVRSQWHRHRTMSYNEISRRYTEVDMELYAPTKFRKQATDNKQSSLDDEFIDPSAEKAAASMIKNAHELLLTVYNTLLKATDGVCREQARGILPQNMMTTFYATVNFRNLLHFLSLRMDKHAQWEIRQYANAIHDMLVPMFPNVMKAFDEGRIK
jgi:thymidylate synthase (FAD)